jgi:hypothetical protein
VSAAALPMPPIWRILARAFRIGARRKISVSVRAATAPRAPPPPGAEDTETRDAETQLMVALICAAQI